MPRYKNIDGVNVQFTAEEETASDAEEAEWADDATTRNALAEIQRLEGQVTNRRLREAYTDSTWLDTQEELIVIERGKL